MGSTLPPPPQGLQGLAAAQGLQGFSAAQGLQGLHGFAAAHGLQGLHGFSAAQGFAAPDARMAMTVPCAASVFCPASDHETAANASTINTTPISAENLSDFLEKPVLMAHFLPYLLRRRLNTSSTACAVNASCCTSLNARN